MGKLHKSAHYIPGDVSDSNEIDEGFNQAVDAFVRKRKRIRKEESQRRQSSHRNSGVEYNVMGSLFTDERLVPLEDCVWAESVRDAMKQVRTLANQYRNIEGYAVTLTLYDKVTGKSIDGVRVKAKK